MNEEITLDDILWQLEKHPIDSDYVFGCKEVKIIYDSIIKLKKENKQLKDNWNKLKEYINRYIKYDKYGRKISKCLNAIVIMNKINKLEQGSDSNE